MTNIKTTDIKYKEKLEQESLIKLEEILNNYSFKKECLFYRSNNKLVTITNSFNPNNFKPNLKSYCKVNKFKDIQFYDDFVDYFNSQTITFKSFNDLKYYLKQFEENYDYKLFPLEKNYTQWNFLNIISLRNIYHKENHYWHVKLNDSLHNIIGESLIKKYSVGDTRKETIIKLNNKLPVGYKIPDIIAMKNK